MIPRIALPLLMLVVACPALSARAQEKVSDEQFVATAVWRAKAELAVRKAKAYYDENENRWRATGAAIDAARTQLAESIRKSAEDEQRKAEELRNLNVIEELNQRRAAVDQDYQRFTAVDRPALESAYRAGAPQAQALLQLFQQFTALDAGWKDCRVDLAALQTAYEAIAARADAIRAAAEKAQTDLQQHRKTWESAAASTTRPSAIK